MCFLNTPCARVFEASEKLKALYEILISFYFTRGNADETQSDMLERKPFKMIQKQNQCVFMTHACFLLLLLFVPVMRDFYSIFCGA